MFHELCKALGGAPALHCSAAASPAMQQLLCLMASAASLAHLQCSSGGLRGWCTMQEAEGPNLHHSDGKVHLLAGRKCMTAGHRV